MSSTTYHLRTAVHLALLSLMFLAGCALPAATTTAVPPTQDISAQYTSAVQTVTGKLTQDAAVTPPPANPTVVVSSATPGPTDTTAPTATSAPTTLTATNAPATQAAATVPSSDPRASLGTPDFHEPFDDETNWSFEKDDHSDMALDNGMLVMTAFEANAWDSWTITWINGEDFYIEMTAAPNACSGLDRYGIIFRAKQDASEGYLFALTCDGHYSLRVWDGEEYTRIVDWSASDKVNAGANKTNRLGVWADGTTIRLYANGYLLKEVVDDTYAEGHMGVWIGAVNTENFTVKVDQIDWWDQ
jgi:hypothetical protein